MSEAQPEWGTIAILGVGLIGGSIGLAVRQRRLAREVVGVGRRDAVLQQAVALGALDRYTLDLADGVRNADLVLICSPVDTIAELARQVAEHCPTTALISDAGSTKQQVVAELAGRLPRGVTFVGGHPLAGSEKTGVAAGRSDLFAGRLVVLTPTPATPAGATNRLTSFWESLGARVAQLSAADHDAVLAATSHVPHVIAALLAAATPPDCLPFTSTGWADTTRIAAGDVELWRQILAQNRDSVLQGLDRFAKVLNSFSTALERQDDAAVAELLALGKQRRDALAD